MVKAIHYHHGRANARYRYRRKRDIYDLMNELTNDGVSIIMVSSELPEVLGMSDRVMVIHEGRVAGILDRSDATPESIMTLATGGQ